MVPEGRVRTPEPCAGRGHAACPQGVAAERRPEFRWEPVQDATWYQITINRNNTLHTRQWLEGAASYTPAADLQYGSYRWWVRTWNPDGYGPLSAPMDFSVGERSRSRRRAS